MNTMTDAAMLTLDHAPLLGQAAPFAVAALGLTVLAAGLHRRYAGGRLVRGYLPWAAAAIIIFSAVVPLTRAADTAAESAERGQLRAVSAWASVRYDVDVSEHLAVELLAGRAGPSSEAGSIRLDTAGGHDRLIIVTSGLELPVVHR